MKLVAIACHLTPDVKSSLTDQRTAAQTAILAAERVRDTLEITDPVTLVSDPDSRKLIEQWIPDGWNHIDLRSIVKAESPETGVAAGAATRAVGPEAILGALETLPAANEEPLVLVSLDEPFVSPDLAKQAADLHVRWWCDYTFADGYPDGLGAQIVRRETVPALRALAVDREVPWSRDWLFQTVSKDINAFDIETVVPETDYGLLRMSLTADSASNVARCAAIAGELGLRPPLDDLLSLVETSPVVQRTLPTYVFVQITERLAQQPVYSPWRLPELKVDDPSDMTPEQFEYICDKLEAFCPGATLAIGYRGEPALHPQIGTILETIHGHPKISAIVETSGIGWGSSPVDRLERYLGENLTFIVELDTDDPDIYQRVRGDGYEEANRFARAMVESFPIAIYVQATRLEETESNLPSFYRTWKELTDNVIIQKFNNYAGLLPDRKVADLSPLVRFPCRHLQRELAIRVNGQVVRCFQDLNAEAVRGNIFEDSMSAVWANGAQEYQDHISGRLSAMCARCDEYYTFNA